MLDTADKIIIDGGKGVGRVTKPGLGLEIGKAAINPTPLKMINQAIDEVLGELKNRYGVSVIISVPKGEEIAKKTDNPRLGIIGGISILGTTGIVIPYSTASFAASIRQSIDVSRAMGSDSVILTTGGRSEDFARCHLRKFNCGSCLYSNWRFYWICHQAMCAEENKKGICGRVYW